MYYILDEKIALRSWWGVPFAYYVRYHQMAKGLSKEEYDFLLQCNGQSDIPESEIARELCSRGLCHLVKRNAAVLSEWQKPMMCNNRYMPLMNWMITGKCNYNCLHCFNAVDNTPLQSEFSWEEAETLMDEAQKCGINGFTITGGEPMIHKCFLDIVRGIYQRGMYIFDLNTNGFFLTQEILDEMKKMGCFPAMKISFDGIGFHDYMRGFEGAQEKTIHAVKLCIENGFKVKAQMQLNRGNKECIIQSLNMLEQLGVGHTLLIRTSESPRWEQNSDEKTLTFAEYYDTCLEIAKEYVAGEHHMRVTFSQFFSIFPEKKKYISYGKREKPNFSESLPLCCSARSMVSVGADGQIYPCLQMSGWFMDHGKSLGNVKTEGLQKALQDSEYMREVCTTVHDLTMKNEECRQCPYLQECRGGCRAYAILTAGGLRERDKSKCLYFKHEYPKKISEVLKDYTCL